MAVNNSQLVSSWILQRKKWVRYFLFEPCFRCNPLSKCFLFRFLLNFFCGNFKTSWLRFIVRVLSQHCWNIIWVNATQSKLSALAFQTLYSHSVHLSLSSQFFTMYHKVWQFFTHISGDTSWKHDTKSSSSNTVIHCYFCGKYFPVISSDNTKTRKKKFISF